MIAGIGGGMAWGLILGSFIGMIRMFMFWYSGKPDNLPKLKLFKEPAKSHAGIDKLSQQGLEPLYRVREGNKIVGPFPKSKIDSMRDRFSYNAAIKREGTDEWLYLDRYTFPNEPLPPNKQKAKSVLYFVNDEDKEFGPFKMRELQRRKSQFSADALYRQDGSAGWYDLNKLPG